MKTSSSWTTKSDAQKSRDCAPASCIAVLKNVLERIMSHGYFSVKGVGV